MIGSEPLIPRYAVKNPAADFPSADIFHDLQQLSPTPELKKTVEDLRNLIESGRLEVRVFRENFLHAKCFIFGDYESSHAVGII